MSQDALTTGDRELSYYKRRLDELAGESLRQDYELAGLRKEVNQKRQAFRLLSRLQQTIGTREDLSGILGLVLREVNSTLGMDRTVVLVPTEGEGRYRPWQWTGFAEEGRIEEFDERMSCFEIELPEDLLLGRSPLLANKKSEATPLIERLREAFELPYLVGVPVMVESVPAAVILSGRVKEAGSLYPPLDRSDVETFQAIASLVSRSIENRRIGALKEMDRLKTEFFANISHEFRTPVTLTLGPLEGMLEGRFGPISEAVREQALVMQRSQARLLGLIHQVLSLAQLEAGRFRLRVAPVPSLNGFFEERLGPFRAAALQKGLDFSVSFATELNGRNDVFVDRERLDEVLSNLLSNALKFTRQGAVHVFTEVDDVELRLGVTDTGIGIGSDDLPHIFDRFRQADGSIAREFGGSGLGLAWSKEIIELHGGTITVDSTPRKGSAFTVHLPLGKRHLDPSSVVEFEETDLPRVGDDSRAYFLSERPADREAIDELNRASEAIFDPLRATLLCVEDNPDLQLWLRDLLRDRYNVFLACDGRDGLDKARRYSPDLMIVDLMMPRMSGLELLVALRGEPETAGMQVLFLSARASVDARVGGLEAGADDYLTKPFESAELHARIRNLLRIRQQERELQELNQELEARIEHQMAAMVRRKETPRFLPTAVVESFVSHSTRMQEVLDVTWKVADSESTVLIRGETGSGKEVVAQAIHVRSPRRDGPFVPVNCAGIPANLFESELFGHEKGAFTGAVAQRKGRFELANGGTLFLDEIGDIPAEAQMKLLRVLQERRLERVGGNETIAIDVRVIAATNRDLEHLMRVGSFREDLYYRLNVIPIAVPPLRERREDITLLAQHFLDRYRRRSGRHSLAFSPDAIECLREYRWPGNVRELQNVIERMAVLVDGETILRHDLPSEIRSGSRARVSRPTISEPFPTLQEQERMHVLDALRRSGGVIRGDGGAAALLGLPESTLRYRMKKLGLTRERIGHWRARGTLLEEK